MKKLKIETVPFSPAVRAALQMAQRAFEQQITGLLGEEARSLQLPEGWRADVAKGVWRVPRAR